jgi:ABC-2 type transport system permease protein|tara:strand:+ start:214 stop:1026 length:813 start_codon:yes stop_codon:yes gene_type:complete
MVELEKKYQVGVRRFGLINWVGTYSLLKKEILRFLTVSGQTLAGPILTSVLFLTVISLAIGEDRSNVLGVPYIQFLASGLIMMQVIQQSFAHTSSSIVMGKMMGTITDIIHSPLSAAEVITAITLAGAARGLLIAFISTLIFIIFIDLTIQNYFLWFVYLFLGGIFMGSTGIIVGLYADKFDQMSTVTNFIIIPLSFLSGTFYSIDRLPELLKILSLYNPFFHMIDGFRYSFIGQLDGSLKFGILLLTIVSLISYFLSYHLFNKGYKIKS